MRTRSPKRRVLWRSIRRSAEPTSTIYLAALGHAYGVAGRRDKALAVLADLQTRTRSRYISALDIATVYLGLGDTDETFEWLERAFETRASALVYLAVDPRYDPIREDPRFQNLIRRIGLPEVPGPDARDWLTSSRSTDWPEHLPTAGSIGQGGSR
jgi:hypothetical protein